MMFLHETKKEEVYTWMSYYKYRADTVYTVTTQNVLLYSKMN